MIRFPSLPAPGLLPALLAAAIFALLAFSPDTQGDGDTLWHIKAGEWMLAHAQVPSSDIFSHTMPGAPWHTQEWLAEIAMALAFQLAGLSGVMVLSGVAAALTVWLVARYIEANGLKVAGVLILTFMMFLLLSQSFVARPHLLAQPLLAFWTLRLMRASEAGAPPAIPASAALMVLWANLHASFFVGLFLIGIFGLDNAMNAPVERTASVLKSWFIFGLCMLAASLLTPHGINALIYPLAVMKMTSLVHIAEWESANFSKLGPLEMCLLAFLYVVMAYGVKLRPMRALLLIVLLHLTLQHIRQETLLAIVGTLVVTGPLAAVFAPGFSAPVSAKNRTAWGFGTALLAMIALARLAIPDPLVESVTKPLHAMASVSGEMRQRPMLNDYGMGGYLIFLGLRPFIDGRNDMYGDDFTNDFAALGNSDETKLTATLARFDIAWAIFRPGDAMNQRLEHLGWKMTYQDGFAVVHER